jgi:hypothetical protein
VDGRIAVRQIQSLPEEGHKPSLTLHAMLFPDQVHRWRYALRRSSRGSWRLVTGPPSSDAVIAEMTVEVFRSCKEHARTQTKARRLTPIPRSLPSLPGARVWPTELERNDWGNQKARHREPAAHARTRYRCFLPDLAGLAGKRRAGPMPDRVILTGVGRKIGSQLAFRKNSQGGDFQPVISVRNGLEARRTRELTTKLPYSSLSVRNRQQLRG